MEFRIKALRHILINWSLAVIAMSCLPVYAQNVSNNEAKDAAMHNDSQRWRDWKTVGEAQLTWFIFDVYSSRLKSPNGQYMVSDDVSPHPFALEIRYQRDISKQQLLEVTEEQWQKLGFDQVSRSNWISELNKMFVDVRKGDELTYLTDGKTGQLIYRQANDATYYKRGVVSDESMNDAFLSIWLSPRTEYPLLRKQLIGQVR
ncbi:chalcone isomerase family protein [Vibrio mytili]|uniref:chalcone isomerase family protein n=1 Tax=Vibrio mytili TaxID=50718 RepID=UPI00069809A6|nr:chalcone isomerase family protein [Vibrio mytili]